LGRNHQQQARVKGTKAELKTEVDESTDCIKQLEAYTRKLSKEVTEEGKKFAELKKQITSLSRLRTSKAYKKKSDTTDRLRQARHRRAEKTTRYNARKRKRGEDAEPDNSYPTPQKPGCEDFHEHMKLENLPDATITYAGMDYGVVTVPTTVSIHPPRYNFHVELYNSYQALEGHDNQSAINLGDDNKQFLQLPKPFKSTTKDLDWKTRFGAARKSRERRKNNTSEGRAASQAENLLSDNSIESSNTVCKSIAQKSREPLRASYKSKVELKNRKLLNIKNDQIYRKKTLEERTCELVLVIGLRDMREEVETG
ncbi:hypothetical protein DFQ28_004485, partial [Apophysomyces sp. BC1034]